jgi:signal transduction histidine kinase/CheY-like chemotaxis protein
MLRDGREAQPETGARTTPDFLQGGGEMGALMRARDWRATALGAPEAWPQPLRTAVRLILNTGHPMYIWWGADLLCFYNDAYRASIGPERHPGSLGLPGGKVWEEIWDIIGPQIAQVMSGDGATWHRDHLVPITRHGRREEVYWTYSYSPIDDDTAPHGVGGVLVVCSETTDQVQARRDLERAKETLERRVAEALAERKLLADLVEKTDTFIQALDGDYRFLAVNQACADEYERIYGFRPKVGDRLTDRLAGHPELLDAVRAAWDRAFAGETFTLTAEFGDPAIERRWYEIKFSPLLGPEGTRIGAYQFSDDVTERMRAQARLAHAEEQLRHRQKMQAVGQLTGGVAHEFNNLLQIMLGNLDMLRRRLEEGASVTAEDARRMLSTAIRGAERAATLTRRLLAFGRRQPLQPRPLDVNKMIASTTELLRRTLGEAIVLKTRLEPGLWPVSADAHELEGALLNLAVNARDAMPGGGTLAFAAANVHLDAAAAHDDVAEGDYVVIAVSDTGTGMSKDVAARAFDPFFTTKEVGKGSGLGLSQVYGFITQSGGHVRIESREGEGTTIMLSLPRIATAAAPADAASAPRRLERAATKEGVLLVEDDEDVRASTAAMLRELGYDVHEAAAGAGALRLLREQPDVRLLLTDVGLPGGMDGRLLAAAACRQRPGLRVLFTTGYAEAMVEGGAIDPRLEFMTKPFSYATLAAKVRSVLDR